MMAQRTFRLPGLLLSLLGCLAGAPAWANIEIEVRGVNDELRDNVLAYLSFERYRKSESLTPDTLERLHNRIEREVAAAVKPFGFYSPTVRSDLDDLGGGNWRVTIEIEPGPPVVMEDVKVSVRGPGADDPLFTRIVSDPPLRPGQRLSHAAYEKLKGDLQRTAATYGFLNARMTRSELRVDPEKHTASATLELETGPRYRFGTTQIEQDAVDETLVRRFMRYEQDEPFDMTELLRTQFALDDSQYFSTVEVLPGDRDDVEHIVPISIRAERNRRSRYSIGVGYGTDTEARGTVAWEDRRVNTRGHRFNVELEGAATAQSLRSHYIIPIGDPALEKLSFEASYLKERPADIETQDFNLEPSITRVRGQWQYVWFVTASNTTTESAVETQTDNLLIPGINFASVPRGYLGEALFSRGFFAELRGSHSVFGSDSDFLQLDLQFERVFDFGPVWHLFLRGEVGASLVAEFSNLPGSVRFFAGGDRSVRGFGYQELSPVEIVPRVDGNGDPIINPETGKQFMDEVKTGGKHMLTGTVEIIRDLPRSLAVAAFFDIGNAFDKFGDSLENSAGVGLRWRLPVVTVGIDIAQPLSEKGASPRLHLNFSPKL
jgi:translocation and assembly module TamA